MNINDILRGTWRMLDFTGSITNAELQRRMQAPMWSHEYRAMANDAKNIATDVALASKRLEQMYGQNRQQ